jgi:hypothetical protein
VRSEGQIETSHAFVLDTIKDLSHIQYLQQLAAARRLLMPIFKVGELHHSEAISAC